MRELQLLLLEGMAGRESISTALQQSHFFTVIIIISLFFSFSTKYLCQRASPEERQLFCIGMLLQCLLPSPLYPFLIFSNGVLKSFVSLFQWFGRFTIYQYVLYI